MVQSYSGDHQSDARSIPFRSYQKADGNASSEDERKLQGQHLALTCNDSRKIILPLIFSFILYILLISAASRVHDLNTSSSCATAWIDMESFHYYHDHTQEHGTIQEELKHLANQMTGTILFPSDKGYENAAEVWNEAIRVIVRRPPLAVIEAANTQDVSLAINWLAKFQEENHYHGSAPLFAVKAGGHSYAGYSSSAGGIILSVAQLNALSIDFVHDNEDPNQSTAVVKVGPGVTGEDMLDHVLLEHNYCGVLGSASTVAMGGWILGGGVGVHSRQYGFGVDNVLEMEVVLADGSIVTASPTENEDLFWALRGAGQNNFGVVTEIKYKLFPARDEVLVVTGHLPHHLAARFLSQLGEMESSIPSLLFMELNSDPSGLIVTLSWYGQDEQSLSEGQAYITELLSSSLDEKVASAFDFERTSWHDAAEEESEELKGILVQYWNGFLFRGANTEKTWDKVMEALWILVQETDYVVLDIELWGGAMSKVDPNTTALYWRDALFNVGYALAVPADMQDAKAVFERQVHKFNKIWDKVSVYLDGSFPNYAMASISEEDYGKILYGKNIERLQKIKKKYDPTNLFRFPQSVPLPAKKD